MENKLPDGWKITNLEHICNLVTDGTHDKIPRVDKEIGVPIVTPKDITEDGISFKNVNYITKEQHQQIIRRSKPEKGDILYSNIGTIGKPAIVDVDFEFSIKNVALFKIKEALVLNKYIKYYLKCEHVHNFLLKKADGGNQKFISINSLKKIDIVLPPLETQQKIVSILEKAEETKKLRSQADDLTQKLLQSVFLEMFGDPVKNPKKWEKKTLKELGEIITGNTPSRKKPEYYGDYIEWIKSDNINTPYTYLTRSEEMLSEKGAKVGRIAPINSVLVTCIAGSLSCIGNVAIADRSIAFNQQINAIVPNENVNTSFLYHLILNTKEYIQSYSTQSMKGMVSKGVLGSISFIIPPIEVQMRFAEFTKRVEKMITSQNQSSLEINNLFDALMQKAFIGELVS